MNTSDWIRAHSNFYNAGRSGFLNAKGEMLKGRILSLDPQIRVAINGRPGAVILTLDQFQRLWTDK